MTVTDTVEGGVKVVSPLGPRFRIETTTGRPYSNLFGDPETWVKDTYNGSENLSSPQPKPRPNVVEGHQRGKESNWFPVPV